MALPFGDIAEAGRPWLILDRARHRWRIDGAAWRLHAGKNALSERGDPLDLDERILANESRDHNAGRGRPGWTLQQLATDLSGFLVVVEGENELGCLDDIVEAAANAL